MTACTVTALALSGCITRAIIVDSDPPGAAVKINGHLVGVTPLEYEFITHGRYTFLLSKPGFHEIVERRMVRAPWHQWIPLDFFTENLIPLHFNDVHLVQFHLQPLTPAARIAVEPTPPVNEVVAVLRSAREARRRREACLLMMRYHLVGGIAALQEATHDVDPEVRAVAYQALRVVGDPEALPRLIGAVRQDPAAVVRWQAATELEALRSPTAVPALLQALDDRDPLVRTVAVEALRGIGDRAAAPAVSRRLRDGDIVVRRSAADALGVLRDPATANALGRVLRDPDPDVRRRAARSLEILRVPTMSVALARALRDPDPVVRATVIRALQEFGTSDAVPVAVRYLRAWQAAIREAAALALGGLRDLTAVPPLERATAREPNIYTRLAMAKALVQLGARPASSLEPYDRAVREMAARRAALSAKDSLNKNTQSSYNLPRR